MAPRTLVKCRASTAAFFSFCSNAGCSKPHTATEMDLRLCEFVQHSWEEGDSRNIPADARSGLMHFIDAPRGQLHGSQRLLRAWGKNELPMRADPLPINLLLAMVGVALEAQKLRITMSLLIVFHVLLRTNEIIHTQASHFTFPQKVWTSAPCAPTHKVWTTPPKRPRNSHSHRPFGRCVSLGCGTKAPARRKTVSRQHTGISERISQFNTIGSLSSSQVASILFETERSHRALHGVWYFESNYDAW